MPDILGEALRQANALIEDYRAREPQPVIVQLCLKAVGDGATGMYVSAIAKTDHRDRETVEYLRQRATVPFDELVSQPHRLLGAIKSAADAASEAAVRVASEPRPEEWMPREIPLLATGGRVTGLSKPRSEAAEKLAVEIIQLLRTATPSFPADEHRRGPGKAPEGVEMGHLIGLAVCSAPDDGPHTFDLIEGLGRGLGEWMRGEGASSIALTSEYVAKGFTEGQAGFRRTDLDDLDPHQGPTSTAH